MIELFLAALIWSTTPILAKIAYSSGINTATLVEIRLLTGALLFYLLLRKRVKYFIRKVNFIDIFKLSALGLAANFYFYHLGLKYTSASSAQVLESTSPAFVLLLTPFMKVEKADSRKILGVALSLLGTSIIFYTHSGTLKFRGDVLEIFAAISWAFFTVQAGRVLLKIRPEESLFLLFSFSFFLLLPSAVLHGVSLTPVAFTLALIMGFLHTFLAYLLYFRGIARAKPITASLVFTLSPLLTIIFSRAFLGEQPGYIFYAGAFLVLSGIVVALKRE